MSTEEFPKHFDHANCESKVWKLWEDNRIFDAEVDASRPAFCVVIPPPNVTGILHMGHILDNIPQDVMTRWHRMRGFSALWIPGTDHAGIATQSVVKKQLDKEGIDYRSLGREGFIERVWAWKKQSGGTIIEQLKRLGCSCDWRRERFTMDEQLSRAVTEAFIRYYNKGLVYRGKRMINWCTVCETALANDEVEHEERSGHLWHLKYPLMENGKASKTEFLIVATTRPETMLGDTAVAIHPDDPRYKHLHGKSVWLPLQNREIPIIQDDFVDLEFGSGAVKITPAHDVNDYEVGKRHKLNSIQVIGLNGKMTAEAGEFAGLDRFKARAKVVEKLESLELLDHIDSHKNAVGQCYRCNSVVEPLESDQWFVKMKPLAEKAKAAVVDGRIKIIPETEKNDYFHWMDTIEDWCISRQLWWGHRIPVYYCDKCSEMTVAADTPTQCKCGNNSLRQDEDVLDTWFSSQLWPYSTLGWPEQTPELKYWYPNNWLMSGRDILFFWDARMIMSGLELAGDVPFRRLVLHGLVRDAQGRKLSKSLNNSPDPLKLFDEHGTDAIRAAISLRYPMGRQDSKLTDELYRNGTALITKLWNSFRFVVMNLNGQPFSFNSTKLEHTTLEDRWILSRLNATITAHDKLLAEDNLTQAFQTTTGFFWNEFCDWYIEIVKPRFSQGGASREAALGTTLHVLRSLLKVFQPYIPFITEELWQQLAAHGVSDSAEKLSKVVALAEWPKANPVFDDANADRLMHEMMSLVRGVRDARSTLNIPPKTTLKLRLFFFKPENEAAFKEYQPIVSPIAHISSFDTAKAGENPKNHVPFNFEGGVAYLELPADVKSEEVKAKLTAQITGLERELDGISKRMQNAEYVKNAPAHVVDESRARQSELNKSIEKLRGFLERLDKSV